MNEATKARISEANDAIGAARDALRRTSYIASSTARRAKQDRIRAEIVYWQDKLDAAERDARADFNAGPGYSRAARLAGR